MGSFLICIHSGSEVSCLNHAPSAQRTVKVHSISIKVEVVTSAESGVSQRWVRPSTVGLCIWGMAESQRSEAGQMVAR